MQNVSKVPVQPVPKTLYKAPDIESKIATLREEHRAQATQRLEDANAKAPACFDAKKSKRYQRVLEEINEMKMKHRVPIVARKIPNFKVNLSEIVGKIRVNVNRSNIFAECFGQKNCDDYSERRCACSKL